MGSLRDLQNLLIRMMGGLAIPIALSGCLIPTYHQPQGFSSTYYQELQKVAANPPMPVAIPAPGSGARVGGPKDVPPVLKPIETADVPQELEEEPATTTTGSWWSWIRRPLTFRSAQQADSSADEAENEADETPVRR